MADLGLGLATGPVLFACQEFPELEPLIMRKFASPGDVDLARTRVSQSEGLQKTLALAEEYCSAAVQSLDVLTESPHKQALLALAEEVTCRLK